LLIEKEVLKIPMHPRHLGIDIFAYNWSYNLFW